MPPSTSRSRSHSPSREPKRAKIAHHEHGSLENEDCFFVSGELFDPSNIQGLHSSYIKAEPFKYALVERLFQDELLRKVKGECLRELHFTQKETDIYKVNQTGDLASLSFLSQEQIALLPALLKLRDALYSARFRAFLRTVTGCGPLSGTRQDMSVNSYTKGCHLLSHDDVIGTRRVSYILYMPLPDFQPWQREWGGALELYGPRADPIPVASVPPSWNQFVFFEVQPGKSFHAVEEVAVGGEEDGRARLSISGWFHAPQEGEEGYEPEPSVHKVKSSREELTSSSTEFNSYSDSAELPMPDASLSAEHVAFLSEFVNSVYLQPRTMNSLSQRFVQDSSIELHSFLSSAIASKLDSGLRELDSRDGLGPDRPTHIPPHQAGGGGDWTLKGPTHKYRFATLTPSSSSSASAVRPRAVQSPVDLVRSLQDELFASGAFRAWLAAVCRVVPLRYIAEARRFRPGLDYTLAMSEPGEARLDVVLGLTPSASETGTGTDIGESGSAQTQLEENGWKLGEWGGWECYLAPPDGDGDPAVYRSGYGTTTASSHTKGKEAVQNGHAQEEKDVHVGDEEDADADADGEGEDDDGTLLAVQPSFNRLLLVLRDEGVLHFVKYVSAAAQGSRWDVCGEYEIGVLEVQDDGDDV